MEDETFTVNWQLNWAQLDKQLDAFFLKAERENKILTLPITASLDSLVIALSKLSCNNCNAICCKVSPPDGIVALTPTEYKTLRSQYSLNGLKETASGGAIEMPCRFLEHGLCTIYDKRPLACMIFPIQPGGMVSGDTKTLAILQKLYSKPLGS